MGLFGCIFHRNAIIYKRLLRYAMQYGSVCVERANLVNSVRVCPICKKVWVWDHGGFTSGARWFQVKPYEIDLEKAKKTHKKALRDHAKFHKKDQIVMNDL